MSNTKPVTGGDLYHLWWVANRGLTTVENLYIDMTNKHRSLLSDGDSDTFGNCWIAWQDLQDKMHRVLLATGQSLELSSAALNLAIEEFKHVDGGNGDELTTAGKNLQKTLNDDDLHDPEVKLDGELAKPKDLTDEINQHVSGPTIPVGN